MTDIVTDEAVEAALDYLRDNADMAAKARAERIYVEEFRKTLKARLMQEHVGESIGSQEREAYADTRYAAHLDAIKEAVYADERQRFLRQAAIAKVEAWRSASANRRASVL